MKKRLIVASLLLAGLAMSLFAPAATAQGCAMCATTAAQQNERAAQSLNLGILMLLVPSLLLFGGVAFLALRARGAFTPDNTDEPASEVQFTEEDQRILRSQFHLTLAGKDDSPPPRA